MESPKHLSHQPIISINDYDKYDGQFAGETDAMALSIGMAQYDREHLSAKVWRRNNERWSRQSEELPLHRVLDLAILVLASNFVDPDSNVPVTKYAEEINNEVQLRMIKAYFKQNQKNLKPKIEHLKELLAKY